MTVARIATVPSVAATTAMSTLAVGPCGLFVVPLRNSASPRRKPMIGRPGGCRPTSVSALSPRIEPRRLAARRAWIRALLRTRPALDGQDRGCARNEPDHEDADEDRCQTTG